MREIDFHGGFGNRIFFLPGTPKDPIPMPAKPNSHLLLRVQDALKQLDNVSPGEVTLSHDAQSLWSGFYCDWKRTALKFDPLTATATKRIPAYIMKLSLVYSAFESSVAEITEDQLTSAVQVGFYGVECTKRLIQNRWQFTEQDLCEGAVKRVLSKSALPAWKIHQAIGGRFTAERLIRAVRGLLTTGAVIEVGRTKRREPVYGLRGRKR